MWLIRKGGMKIELPTLKETGLHTQVILMYLYVCKKTNIRKNIYVNRNWTKMNVDIIWGTFKITKYFWPIILKISWQHY